MAIKIKISILLIFASFILAACSSPSPQSENSEQSNTERNAEGNSVTKNNNGAQTTPRATIDIDSFDIITLLPRDAIPAIDNPQFYSVEEANQEYADSEQVIGVVFEGEARAYSTGLLSRHEIVNDNVGGRKIAVTW